MKLPFLILAIALTLVIVTSRCSEPPVVVKSNESFDLIQQKILNISCALSGCHASENDVAFAQHKLLLKEGAAYDNLVNADPQNEQARIDGLKRVLPGNADGSLLVHKLHCNNGHHSSDYGNQMPLGMNPLSEGQIEFITKWIEQGAIETGIIEADTSLLSDTSPACEDEFIPMAAPPAGEGYQIKVEPFNVAPNFEREIFVYKEVGNESEIFVKSIALTMRKNSHHFLVNSFSDEIPSNQIPEINTIRDLRDANNNYIMSTVAQMEYQIPTVASQTPALQYNFPPGVALKMPPRHKLDVNLHYVNKTSTSFQGECYINLFTMSAGQVVYEAQSIFLSNDDIFLPPNQKTIANKTFSVTQTMKIFMLTSHTHRLGERFEIQIVGGLRNGEIIYNSSNWHHPEVKTFDPPLELVQGQSLKMMVTYDNTTNKSVKFGLTSEDEMAIIYGYYY
ncbi:hypothetical protein [Chryseolinea sp. H1M3-3]|uniref:monooxygenase n=1 Tax=Chryseolinea sp. H1M3-3 TaxID=3034144 RepID=UPI0023EB760F|nr:hypothetical protein [Chryseolinea sp. H1M3-3]